MYRRWPLCRSRELDEPRRAVRGRDAITCRLDQDIGKLRIAQTVAERISAEPHPVALLLLALPSALWGYSF